jgi:hypothetical protein
MIRGALMLIGLASAAYGGWLLLGLDAGQLTSAGTWLAGGVLLHDAVFAAVILAATWLGARALPKSARPPFTVALIVLVPVTLLSIPVLGRYGARADNPTLLDRPYWTGWLILTALVLSGALIVTLLRAGKRRRDGADTRG